jgi:hypothetical protein
MVQVHQHCAPKVKSERVDREVQRVPLTLDGDHMTDAEREALNICPRCGKPNLRVMVTQTVSAPMSMYRNFTRANMRKKEFEHWGTNWDQADIVCRTDSCGYLIYTPEDEVVRNL